MRFILIILFALSAGLASAQMSSVDSLKMAVRALELQTADINLRMEQSHNRFQAGILVSVLGYSTTIAGGLMLGRENDKLGQALLITGGATGLTGTYLLMTAFNKLAGERRRKR